MTIIIIVLVHSLRIRGVLCFKKITLPIESRKNVIGGFDASPRWRPKATARVASYPRAGPGHRVRWYPNDRCDTRNVPFTKKNRSTLVVVNHYFTEQSKCKLRKIRKLFRVSRAPPPGMDFASNVKSNDTFNLYVKVFLFNLYMFNV